MTSPLNDAQRDPARAPEIASAIAAAQDRLDAYMTAFNARDVAGLEDTFNFPHVRLANGALTLLSPGETRQRIYSQPALSDWARSAWLRREVVHADAHKVHIDTQVARYRADGSVLSTFESFYIVTRIGERWGIQVRSSYAP